MRVHIWVDMKVYSYPDQIMWQTCSTSDVKKIKIKKPKRNSVQWSLPNIFLQYRADY